MTSKVPSRCTGLNYASSDNGPGIHGMSSWCFSSICITVQEDPILKKYKKMNEALAGIIEDYGLVSFLPLNVQV